MSGKEPQSPEERAESLNMIYEGISHVTAKVYEKHPDVLLDLTFELWGQKHVVDAGLLAAGDLDWMSNVGDFQSNSPGTLQARTLLYQRAISMPADSMLIGNLQAGVSRREEAFGTAIGSAPLLLGDLRKLSAADQTWYQTKIKWFEGTSSEHDHQRQLFSTWQLAPAHARSMGRLRTPISYRPRHSRDFPQSVEHFRCYDSTPSHPGWQVQGAFGYGQQERYWSVHEH